MLHAYKPTLPLPVIAVDTLLLVLVVDGYRARFCCVAYALDIWEVELGFRPEEIYTACGRVAAAAAEETEESRGRLDELEVELP